MNKEQEQWEVDFDEAFPTIYLQYYGYKANDVIKIFIRELLEKITFCTAPGCDRGVSLKNGTSEKIKCFTCNGKGFVI